MKDSVKPASEASPIVAAIGHVLLGALAGAASMAVLPHRLVANPPMAGLSLILSPLGNGLVMQAIGRWWDTHPDDRPALFTFRAGAIFAFAMALVRFLWLR